MSSRNYGRSPSPRRRSPRPKEYRESRRRSPPNPYYPGSSSSSYDTKRSPRALSPIPLRVGPSRHSPPPRRGMSPIPLHIPSLKTADYRGTSRLSPPGAKRGYSPPRSLVSGHAYPAPGRRSPPTPPTRGYPSTKSPQMSGGVRRGYSPLPTDSLQYPDYARRKESRSPSRRVSPSQHSRADRRRSPSPANKTTRSRRSPSPPRGKRWYSPSPNEPQATNPTSDSRSTSRPGENRYPTPQGSTYDQGLPMPSRASKLPSLSPPRVSQYRQEDSRLHSSEQNRREDYYPVQREHPALDPFHRQPMTVDPYGREQVAVNPFSTHEGHGSHEDNKVIFDPFRSHPDSLSSVDKRSVDRKSSLSPPPKKYHSSYSAFENRQSHPSNVPVEPRTTKSFPEIPTSGESGRPHIAADEEKYPFHLHERTKVFTATVKEFINSRTGVLEVTQIGNHVLLEPANTFFQISSVWVQDKTGNPYGQPVKYSDLLFSGVSLKKEMPIGSKVCCTAKPVSNACFELLALSVWPPITEQPPDPDISRDEKLERCLLDFNLKYMTSCVQATLPKFPLPSDPNSQAIIWQIKDDNYGIIEVKGGTPENPYRFFVLFHKDQVWLRDGQKGTEVAFFKDKPLGTMAQMGQKVTLSARSIVNTSGADLKPSVLELQAISVVLDLEDFPDSVPRPTRMKCPALPGSGAFMMGSEYTYFFLQQGFNLILNNMLITYLETYKKSYPDLNPACLTMAPFLASSRFESVSTIAKNVPEKKPSRFDQVDSRPPMTNIEALKPAIMVTNPLMPIPISAALPPPRASIPVKLPFQLIHAEGQVVSHPSPACLILKSTNLDKPWTCLVPSSKIYSNQAVTGTIETTYPINSLLHVNAVLINETKSVQFIATLAWNKDKIALTQQESEVRDGPVNKDMMRLYRLLSDRKVFLPILKAKDGKVIKLLDANFGILEAGHYLVLFDTCDVWVNPTTTLDQTGKPLGQFLTFGSEIYFHAALVDSMAGIQYLATAVWLRRDDNVFATSLRLQNPLSRDMIVKAKIDIYNLVVVAVDVSTLKSSESKEKKAEGVFEEKQFKAVGKIRCYPDIECVVAESLDEKWRCLVPISSIKAKISVFGSIPVFLPFGSNIHLNMVLVDESRFVQYVASLAWKPEDEKYLDKSGTLRGNGPKDMLIQKRSLELYHKYSSEEKTKIVPYHQKLVNKYSRTLGKVEKLLDDNYGVIVSGDHNHKILFDACDIYDVKVSITGRVSCTKCIIKHKHSQSQTVKNLSNLIQPGMEVYFNAVMIERNAVYPYLATGVWTSANDSKLKSVKHVGPPAVAKKNLSDEKLANYKMVINIEHDKAKMAPVSFGDVVVGPVPTSYPVPSLLAIPQSSSNIVPPPNIFPGSMGQQQHPGYMPPPLAPLGYNVPPMYPPGFMPYMQQQPGFVPPYLPPGFSPYVGPPIAPVQQQQPLPLPNPVQMTSTATGKQAHYSSGPVLNKPDGSTEKQTHQQSSAQANEELLKKTPLISFVTEAAKPEPEKILDPEDSVSAPFLDNISKLKSGEVGVIKRVFKDSNWKPNDNIVGGLILLTSSNKVCFYMSKYCNGNFKIGQEVKANIVPVTVPASANKIQMKIEFVALTVYHTTSAVYEPNAVKLGKYAETRKKLLEIASLDSDAFALFESLFERVDLNSRRGIKEPEQKPAAVQPQSNKVIHDRMICMLSYKCGLLECHRTGEEGKPIKCYFELEDMNIAGNMTMTDIVRIFSRLGCNLGISYVIKKLDCDVIPYVAEQLRITGTLGPHLKHLGITVLKNYKPLTSEKLKRIQTAKQLYESNSFFAIDKLLAQLKSESNEKSQTSAQTTANATSSSKEDDANHITSAPEDIVLGTGVIKCVLDDNFALVFGPTCAPSDNERSFCLFDVCDLYISLDQTAADAGKKVKDITPVGTRVDYNACFIDGSKCVPYLATSLWLTDNEAMYPPLPSLPRSSIQKDKLEIFLQVADSCKSVVENIRKKMTEESGNQK